ncbi:MAG: hypothetical protein AAFX99_13635, partial [Myxococcota bacterium]
TNGILITRTLAAQLAALAEASPYSLDIRVSIDGTTPEENDPIRGKHTFAKILAGAQTLHQHGINPVFTVTTVHARLAESEGRTEFLQSAQDMRGVHHGMGVIFGSAGDEAMAAGDVAQGAGDLKPEGVEIGEG